MECLLCCVRPTSGLVCKKCGLETTCVLIRREDVFSSVTALELADLTLILRHVGMLWATAVATDAHLRVLTEAGISWQPDR